jgi:hypothetical protein
MSRENGVVASVRNFLAVCILFLCASSLALAQAGRGSISGTVTDPNGAVVPGAPVTLLNRATGGIQHTVTSGAGLYRFISLNPGVYQVTVSQSGFALPGFCRFPRGPASGLERFEVRALC